MASKAIKRTAAISTLNRSQKTRVSRAASREGGGSVGMIRCRSYTRRPKPRERRLMPREGFSRKRGKLDGLVLWRARQGRPRLRQRCLFDDSRRTNACDAEPRERSGRVDYRRRTHDRPAAILSANEAGEDFDETLTKAAASRKIEELQAKTGRGKK